MRARKRKPDYESGLIPGDLVRPRRETVVWAPEAHGAVERASCNSIAMYLCHKRSGVMCVLHMNRFRNTYDADWFVVQRGS